MQDFFFPSDSQENEKARHRPEDIYNTKQEKNYRKYL